MNKSSITRFLCIIGIGAVLLLASSLLLRYYGPNVSKSKSPSNEYTVAYNSIAKTIRVLDKQGKELYSEAVFEYVDFFWSADSKYLALVGRWQGAQNGIETKIVEMKNGGILCYRMPRYAFAVSTGYVVRGNFLAKEFVDEHGVLVEFMGYLDTGEQGWPRMVAGRFIFDTENESIRELHFDQFPFDEFP